MAKLIFGWSPSLDGYVDHLEMRPGPALFRHFVEHVRNLAGSVYGRRTYEIMRYWDEDRPEWDASKVGLRRVRATAAPGHGRSFAVPNSGHWRSTNHLCQS